MTQGPKRAKSRPGGLLARPGNARAAGTAESARCRHRRWEEAKSRLRQDTLWQLCSRYVIYLSWILENLNNFRAIKTQSTLRPFA